LCTGNYYRSRFAEVLFNAVSDRQGLDWRAESRGLAIERGVDNVGPMAAVVVARLRELGILDGRKLRLPLQAREEDFAAAAHVVALKEAEHRPLMEERFPAWVQRVEYWHIHDADCGIVEEALAGIKREVHALAARLATAADRGR
jgi:protein-tyrosine phosphatase